MGVSSFLVFVADVSTNCVQQWEARAVWLQGRGDSDEEHD